MPNIKISSRYINNLFIYTLTLVFLISPSIAYTKGNLSLIRDSEIENLILDYAKPIYASAGLDADSVRIIIVNDQSINAFVAGGQNLFFNTGLITKVSTPEMLISVIAHEVGHIAAGHLSQISGSMKNSSILAITGLLLGVAAVASGLSEAGAATASLGTHVAQRDFLSNTRNKEGEADQLALKYMEENNYSNTGFLDLLKLLKQRNNWLIGDVDQYSITHPTSEKRISHVEDYINKNYTPKKNVDAKKFKIIQAKIKAYLLPVSKAKELFKSNSTQDIYAKAIIAKREGKYSQSLALSAQLLAREPNNPYYHELKGRTYFASGNYVQALISHNIALKHLPEDYLISMEKAKSLIATNQTKNILASQILLNNLAIQNPDEAQIWKLLAATNELTNNQDSKFYNLARYNFLLRKFDKAKLYANKAKSLNKQQNTGVALLSQDLLQAIEIEEDKDDSFF